MLYHDKYCSVKGVISLLLIIFLLIPHHHYAQGKEEPAYVVIGAFAIEKNAKKLVEYAKQNDISVKYEIHPVKDLFYVYEYVDKPLEERERILSQYPEFHDVWVYRGDLGRNDIARQDAVRSITMSESSAEASAGIGYVEANTTTITEHEGTQADRLEVTEEVTVDELPAKDMVLDMDQKERVIQNIEPEEGYYYLYFNTINSKNMKEVKGPVNVIDPIRAKKLTEAKSHEVVPLKDPKNGSAVIKASANIFGFREVQHSISLENPVNDTTSNYIHTIGDSIVIDYELERLKKGDVVIMYNVYFFKDAAIMKPESIYELNALLDMLKENNDLVVKLHGHTNGNSHGKILHLDLEDRNFFSLNAVHKEDKGSAKKLSEYRAYTIQHWLMDQGISEDRIEIKGWGGKQMIYDKHDTQAFKNVRVEVEIVED